MPMMMAAEVKQTIEPCAIAVTKLAGMLTPKPLGSTTSRNPSGGAYRSAPPEAGGPVRSVVGAAAGVGNADGTGSAAHGDPAAPVPTPAPVLTVGATGAADGLWRNRNSPVAESAS